MRTEHACGRIRVQTLDEIAWRAATHLTGLTKPWALTMDPEGLVQLERPDHAHPDDLLGVFDGRAGLFTVSRRVLEELREVMRTRPPREKARRVVAPRRTSKAA